jgi:ABC-2 type transport system ATP-binding protein
MITVLACRWQAPLAPAKETTMTMVDIAIQTTGLSKHYGEVQALEHLNLVVPRHSIFGFLGPNGAGKTTNMKLLLGLSRPTAGSATVLGLDALKDSVAIRRRIGYLPQHPTFPRGMTAREVLRFTARFFYSGPKPALESRIDDLLALVGLDDRADRPVDRFSGGERQRLGLAQAQVNQPELLVLDEPAAALDPIGRHEVLQVMAQLRERATIFYSTHILDDVQQVSDTVAILNRGRLAAQGPIAALLSGGDGAVVYKIELKGDARRAAARIKRQPWIRDIDVTQNNGHSTWQVTVAPDGEQAAEASLLRLVLADSQLVVTQFSRKQYELEEVFMRFVEEANHDRQ